MKAIRIACILIFLLLLAIFFFFQIYSPAVEQGSIRATSVPEATPTPAEKLVGTIPPGLLETAVPNSSYHRGSYRFTGSGIAPGGVNGFPGCSADTNTITKADLAASYIDVRFQPRCRNGRQGHFLLYRWIRQFQIQSAHSGSGHRGQADAP